LCGHIANDDGVNRKEVLMFKINIPQIGVIHNFYLLDLYFIEEIVLLHITYNIYMQRIYVIRLTHAYTLKHRSYSNCLLLCVLYLSLRDNRQSDFLKSESMYNFYPLANHSVLVAVAYKASKRIKGFRL